jgi:hypothetical protein
VAQTYCTYTFVNRGSSVSILSDCGLDGRGSIPDTVRGFFPLTSASSPALGPTQHHVQWVPWALSPGVKCGRGVMLTTHPLLEPRLRKSRSCTSCHPNAPLWSVTGPLYLYTFTLRHTHTNSVCFTLEVTEYFIHQLCEADLRTRARGAISSLINSRTAR